MIWQTFAHNSKISFINHMIRCLMLNLPYITITQIFGMNAFRKLSYQITWAKIDPRLDNSFFTNLTPKWQRNCALRTDYERRQALVEIDVLAAMALGSDPG